MAPGWAPGVPGCPLPPRRNEEPEEEADPERHHATVEDELARERATNAQRWAEQVLRELHELREAQDDAHLSIGVRFAALESDVSQLKTGQSHRRDYRLAIFGMVTAVVTAIIAGAFTYASNRPAPTPAPIASTHSLTQQELEAIADARLSVALAKRDSLGSAADTIVAEPPKGR